VEVVVKDDLRVRRPIGIRKQGKGVLAGRLPLAVGRHWSGAVGALWVMCGLAGSVGDPGGRERRWKWAARAGQILGIVSEAAARS
jgi:hypothetical protein